MTPINKDMPCYNCGSSHAKPYAEENGFHLVKCTNCGLLYVSDPPDRASITEAHRQGRHVGSKELDVTGRFNAGFIPFYLKVLKNSYGDDLRKINSWLDVGCGHGEFLQALALRSNGSIRTRGTEPNEKKQASAQSRGLDVVYFDLDGHRNRYDVISFLNVYSHLPDPPAFVSSLRRLLNTNGEIFLQTGDTAHLDASEQYRPLYLPDHLSFASEQIVTGILRNAGFEIINVTKYSYLSTSPLSVIKEVIKTALPGYQSKLILYANWRRYARTNMFVRARLAA
jgi:SAM-dependent methyltransferase